MIHEEICTYEVCKLAKEKGFPQEIEVGTHWTTTKYYKNACIGEYFIGDVEKVETTKDEIDAIHLIKNEGVGIVLPTHSELQRWLRDNHEVDVWVSTAATMATKNKRCYYWHIAYDTNNGMAISIHESMVSYSTFEKALEEGLKEALIEFV